MPRARALGAVSDVTGVARDALVDGDAARWAERVDRWAGPDDVDRAGERPFVAPQLRFAERRDRRLTAADLDAVLRGEVRVMQRGGAGVDYVMRDHHMVDAVLYHYTATGDLPSALFHADRHSDWCDDRYLNARRPAQAATWWPLLEGVKRPGGAPVLGEGAVHFTTAAPAGPLAGRDVGAATRVPWWVDRGALGYEVVLGAAAAADWVSLDLDYFLPHAQWQLTRGLLRDPRFHALMRGAKVRVFVISPQFLAGGEVLSDWAVRGSVAALRLVNLLRGTRFRSAGGVDQNGQKMGTNATVVTPTITLSGRPSRG